VLSCLDNFRHCRKSEKPAELAKDIKWVNKLADAG
jgi:hypothetical protein